MGWNTRDLCPARENKEKTVNQVQNEGGTKESKSVKRIAARRALTYKGRSNAASSLIWYAATGQGTGNGTTVPAKRPRGGER